MELTEQALKPDMDDLDETALWLRLNAAKARLFRTRDLGEQIAIRAEIGELSSRIHKLRREAARTKAQG